MNGKVQRRRHQIDRGIRWVIITRSRRRFFPWSFDYFRFMLCHDLDAFHSTKTRRQRRVSQSKHSAVNQPLNCKAQLLKSPATTRRRSMCSESSELQAIQQFIDAPTELHLFALLGSQMAVNSCCNHMTIQRCNSGWVHWKPNVTKPVPRVDHKHCQPHHRKTSRNDDRSSPSRKSKRNV